MRDLFAGVAPTGTFEDDLVAMLRDEPLPMSAATAAIGAKRRKQLLTAKLRLPPCPRPPDGPPRRLRRRRGGRPRRHRLRRQPGHARRRLPLRRPAPVRGRAVEVGGRSGARQGTVADVLRDDTVSLSMPDTQPTMHRNGRNANQIAYDDAKSAVEAMDPAEIGRRTQLALTSSVAGKDSNASRSLESAGASAHKAAPHGETGTTPAGESTLAQAQSPTTWSDQNADGTNYWALYYKERGPNCAAPWLHLHVWLSVRRRKRKWHDVGNGQTYPGADQRDRQY